VTLARLSGSVAERAT